MKLRLVLSSLLTVAIVNVLLAAPPSYKTIPDGLIIFTDSLVTGTSNAVRLEVIADNIIRVTAAPAKEIVPLQSLVTLDKKRTDVFWEVIPSKESLTLRTKKLTAIVDLKTGAVSFRDPRGGKILEEKRPLGRSFQA